MSKKEFIEKVRDLGYYVSDEKEYIKIYDMRTHTSIVWIYQRKPFRIDSDFLSNVELDVELYKLIFDFILNPTKYLIISGITGKYIKYEHKTCRETSRNKATEFAMNEALYIMSQLGEEYRMEEL